VSQKKEHCATCARALHDFALPEDALGSPKTMANPVLPQCPRLRPIETIFVPHQEHVHALVLRDVEGIAPSAVSLPGSLAAIVLRFDGRRTLAQIAVEASRATGRHIDAELVGQLARELDAAYMLDTPRFHARKREAIRAFRVANVREAAHAGSAYYDDAAELCRFIESNCLAKAPARTQTGSILGLCAPHMDLWRAAIGYGHAYRALGEALDDSVDTFVLLGTSHALMRRPFAVCSKIFATPLGELDVDHAAIRELESASRFDVHEDEYLHKTEHSLEFQAVFLRHALGARPARIIPILCGLGEAQASARDPARDPEAESFLRALQRVVEHRRGRVLVVTGADLAHVGPRFGDARPLDERERAALEQRDAESIALALQRDAHGFFAHVSADLETRRVCGLGPIYTMLRVLPESRGEKLHYAQSIDANEGSIVSHASIAFYG